MNVMDNQILCSIDEVKLFGDELIDHLHGVKTIPAGCVMLFVVKGQYGTTKAYFQLLQDVEIKKLKNATLMYFEPGSIVYESATKYKPTTFRFGNCRFPTSSEYNVYNRKCRL